jgi:hypothetical protein
MAEMTLAEFERLVERMWKAYERFEKALEYKDESSHEIASGQEEYNRYLVLRLQVEAHRNQFSWMDVKYPDA